MKGNRYLPVLVTAGFALLALAVPRASAQNYLFNEAGFTTGTSPEALTSADFNGDGQPDLAVVNHGAATVSILLGKSNGTFAPKVDYSVGSDPDAVVAADFNGDGKIDLAVVSSAGNSVSLLIGAGDGTFTVSGTLATGNNPKSIAAGDFNLDNKIDLVVANFDTEGTVSVFLGNGDGTFGAATTVATGTSPDSVAVGDFNNDGKPDVVTADYGSNKISILLGNGDGTFQANVDYSCGANPTQVIVEDFNNDGNLDLAVADGNADDVVIMLGNGKGTYASQEHIATSKVPSKLVSGDFNGDGNEDIAYTSTLGNFVAILLGTGNGTFNSPAEPLPPMYVTGLTGNSAPAVITADFNGDGRLDLGIANTGDNNVTIMLGNGDGSFQSTTPSTLLQSGPVAVATADFNGDGKLDAVIVSLTNGTLSVLIGSGNGSFLTPVAYSTGTCANGAPCNPQAVAVGDLNRDGFPDLAVVNAPASSNGNVSVLFNNGDGTFGSPVAYSVATFPTAVAIADFNGDGLPDLAVGDSGDGNIYIFLNTGSGVFGTPQTFPAGYPTAIAVGNLFGHSNGTLDLAVAEGAGNSVDVLEGNGNGTFGAAVPYSVATTSVTNPSPVAVAIGDFNGDGFPDLATADNRSNTVSVLLNSASHPGTFGTATTFATGITPTSIAAGDLNGDGLTDLAVGVTSSVVDSVSALFGNGDGTFQTHIDHATGFNAGPTTGTIAEPVALGDFTGSGSLDVFAGDYTYDLVDVFLNTPVIAISPASVAFPGTLVGTTSSAVTVSVSNPGSVPLPFTSAAITLGSPTFAASNNCPATIAVGGSCAVSVTFAPAAGGSDTGTLTVNDGASTTPQAVALSGTGTAPATSLSVTSLTFAVQNIGTTSAAQTVTLSNTGTGPLDITSIAASAQFGQTNTCGSSVAAGAQCTVSVTFTPTAGGTQTGTLTFTDNASNSPQTVALTGTGSGPAVNLTPASLTFAGQPVNTTSLPQTVTLKNSGTATLVITSIAASGPYKQTNTCGASLGGGGSCSITVTFTPTATGTQTGSVTLTDSAYGSPQILPLTGTGTNAPLVTLSPNSVTFPSTAVGVKSSAQVVTLTNTGNESASITSITLSGTNMSDFTETNTCGSSVAAGKSCTISVTFTPGATGNRSATLSVADNAAGSPQTVTLSGAGSSQASVSLSPTSINFGTVSLGANAPKLVTVTNTGNTTLIVSSITVSGNSSFTEADTCVSATSGIAAGKTCTITVTFAPNASGTLTASLDVADNAGSGLQVVSLSGSGGGPSATLAPTSLAFGGQSLSSQSAAKTVTLTNSGNAALSITTISFAGTGASEFTQSNTCGTSVAVGSSCTISVVFSPTSVGNQAATLSIADNASNSPQTVALSGAGNGFALSSTNSSITVTQGQSATYNLSIAGQGAFSGAVSLTCGDAVAGTSCTVFPSSVNVTAPNSVSASVTLMTTAGGLPPQLPPSPAPPRPWVWLGMAATVAIGIKLLMNRLGGRRRAGWALAGALALVLVWAACGGSSSTTTMSTATPPGSYTVTVTGTSGSVTASTTLTVVVTQ